MVKTSLGEQEASGNYSVVGGLVPPGAALGVGVGAAGRGGRLRRRRRPRDHGAELGAADASVAVAVDGDPVGRLRSVARQLVPAQVAVPVAVEAVEQLIRGLGLGAPRGTRHQK